MRIYLLSIFLPFFGNILIANDTIIFSPDNIILSTETYTLSGYIKDAQTGETLLGANIYNKEFPSQGTTSNLYGFYSLTLEEGNYTIVFSYLGYEDQEIQINLKESQRLNVEMDNGVTMKEVVVEATEKEKNVESTEMGRIELQVEQIKTLPVVFGEIDILKTLQLLPGVQSAGEGNAGFYVRGGGPDQNLILLDEAVVYNSGHMLGFFSVFNADAIKNTTLIKGGMPASYGGRLSSVVDVQMKEGNDKKFVAEGGIGLIASRLTLQGPIQKEKSSFIISGRRTYGFDLAQPAIKKTDFAGTNYYFYDLNAKVNHRFSDKDRLFLSAYFGRDVLKFRSPVRDFFFDLPYGNATATLRWNHLFNEKLFSNVSIIYNDYEFKFEGGQDVFKVNVISGVRDWNAKVDFDYFPNVQHQIKFGANYSYHKLTPNIANGTDGTTEFSNNLESQYAHDAAIYLLDDWKINNLWSLNYGLRATIFQQVGPYTSKINGKEYKKGEPVKTYYDLEPRLSTKVKLSKNSSFKAGITFTNQYLHLVSNSTSTLPTDVWVPSTEIVKPQKGIQYAIGYFKNFKKNEYESSVEVYYKQLRNQIDYAESYVNNVADDLENVFVFGKGNSYGLELFLKKKYGKLNGWIGYTLSKTDRIFPDINDGSTFPAIYDRRHDLSVVANYQVSKKWTFSGAFIYGTGNAFTAIKSLYFIEQTLNPEFDIRNGARIEAYHRLDLSATLTPISKKEKKFKSFWTFSIYNVYNRKNTFFVYYDFQTSFEEGTAGAKAFKVSLFPIIPSVTWNFRIGE